MRAAGRIAALARDAVAKAIRPGIATRELDAVAEEVIRRHGAIPSFKGYPNPIPGGPAFPGSICASINSEVVHGIPGRRRLKGGDILSVDVGAYFEGFHGDCACTLMVGEADPEARRLIRVTQDCLQAATGECQPRKRLSDLSHAIQTHAEQHGFSVVREYVGHGIGRNMHEDPQIPNFGPPGMGPILQAGMVFAIEPMVNVGTFQVKTGKDMWTVVTADGSLSAHFEDTVAVTDQGPVVLTAL